MIVSELITLGTAIVTLLATIAGSSACVYLSSRNNKTNVTVLKDKLHALENLIQALQQKVSLTSVVVPNPRPWIEEAQKFLSTLNVVKLEKRLNEKCMNGILPHCCVQRVTRSSIEDKFAGLDDMTERGQRILRESTVRGFKQLPEEVVVGKSRIDAKEKIWQLVSVANEVGSICIHGTTGVGKTTVAIAIHNKALEEVGTLFDYVIWVSLTYGGSLCQVQEDIASSLKIELPNTSYTPERARILEITLLKMNKFLLILDSMWQSFSVKDIGIPELVDGRKLIVTSRISTVSVFNRTTRSHKIEIKPLGVVDAWKLFVNEVGGSTDLSRLNPETHASTKTAVTDLDGLPLAIKLLAQTLSEIQEDTPARLNGVWMEELAGLDSNTRMSSRQGIRDQELYACFKYSYDNLSVETRPCFLFCALFPKDHPIESKELIEYWMWEGLLGNIETLERCRRRGQDTLKELKYAHLLESVPTTGEWCQGSDQDKVKMLNLVRYMAINTMVKAVPEGVIIRSGDSLTDLPTSHNWPPKVKRASFIKNNLKSLVLRNSEPNYKQLSTLLLLHNPLDHKHDNNFFYNMRELRVLDLSLTKISTLPQSLSYLSSLRALLLRRCPNLKKLPSLSRLQELIVLSLSGTPLDHCPKGLQNMMKLRSLDLSQTRIKTFPPNVVGKLIQLEELLLLTDNDNRGYVWGSKQLDKQWKGACVEELEGLENLSVLELNFLNARVFDVYVNKAKTNFKVPSKFRFCVGELQNAGYVAENSVIVSDSHSITLPNGISELHLTICDAETRLLQLGGCLRDLNVLDVSHFSGLCYLFTVEILGSLKMLRKLCVRSCKKMVGVVRPAAQDNPAKVVHHGLTSMVFFDLPSLQSICRGQVLDCPRLLSLEVWRCGKLKLPMILGTSGRKIEIRGERRWLCNLRWDNPGNSNTLFYQDEEPQTSLNLRFVEALVPLELDATTTRNDLQEEEEEEKEEEKESTNNFVATEKIDTSNWFWNWLGSS